MTNPPGWPAPKPSRCPCDECRKRARKESFAGYLTVGGDSRLCDIAFRTMTPKQPFQPGRLLTAGEVAQMFGVDAKTIVRWDKAGKLPAGIRTLGGHRRWHETDIRALFAEHSDRPVTIDITEEPTGRIRTLDQPWWDEGDEGRGR